MVAPFFGLATACIPHAGERSRHLQLIRSTDSGTSPDDEPPGVSVPQELLRANKACLERRLRDLGLLVGVNDAESIKQLKPRFLVPDTLEEQANVSA